MSDKTKEEFEAWLASYESRREKNGWMPLEASIHVRMHEAWKASRAAIEVDWPDQHTYTAPDCAGAAILDCRTAFNKAVKVKP